jgi:hypothetical protein
LNQASFPLVESMACSPERVASTVAMKVVSRVGWWKVARASFLHLAGSLDD